jgi:serralysin
VPTSSSGGKGSDFADGGSGVDLLRGNAGGDDLEGGSGHDRLRGDESDDHVLAFEEDDFVSGGADRDELFGDDEVKVAGRRDDVIYACDRQRDRVNGGPGRDAPSPTRSTVFRQRPFAGAFRLPAEFAVP